MLGQEQSAARALDLTRMPNPQPSRSRRLVAAFALVAGVSLLLAGMALHQPEPAQKLSNIASNKAISHSAEEFSEPEEDTVSRFDTQLVVLPQHDLRQQYPDLPVSHLLRQPVRVTDIAAKAQNLPDTVSRALSGLGYTAMRDDGLAQLLVRTLAEGQSDAYVDAALNMASTRGDFVVPDTLLTPEGTINTDVLLNALLREIVP